MKLVAMLDDSYEGSARFVEYSNGEFHVSYYGEFAGQPFRKIGDVPIKRMASFIIGYYIPVEPAIVFDNALLEAWREELTVMVMMEAL